MFNNKNITLKIKITMSSLYNIKSIPKEVGPGVWISIHIIAFNSNTKELQNIHCNTIRMLVYSFPCGDCRNRGIKYIEANPPEDVISDDPSTLFKWTCDFHNHVNKNETHTSQLEWKTLYEVYKKNAPTDFGLIKSVKMSSSQKLNDSLFKKVMVYKKQ